MTSRSCYLKTSKSVEYDLKHPKISLVFPIHNEEKLLPYSLRSLEKCRVDEIVFLLDRCSDNSFRVVLKHVLTRFPNIFTKILVNNGTSWNNPIAEAFEKAFSESTGAIIYTMASDIITDPEIYLMPYLIFWEFDLFSFQYFNHSPNKVSWHETYSNLLGKLPFTYKCKYGKWSGHFAMKRKVWETLHFHDVKSPDLDFFNRAYEAGFKHHFFKSNTIHLRPGLRKEKQIDQAEQRFKTGVNPLKVLAHSALTVKPHLLAHYLKLRLKK